eukprot:CAMPEP_0206534796 /NCGR_PEP_ID=MMETSP0325_2-20121206/5752_1 /ASSEMBLY_ACC=CAM_ASM_000347 /TAXON_ID=2866 /ORGANISM="Crypthecodinium cohnii, Strain Seligo" /LENGTH=534 /DNA_ID=CAMNT_0054031655 /DNA_START=18 /DNA_END=1622 /DNA_ORIENTATION=-
MPGAVEPMEIEAPANAQPNGATPLIGESSEAEASGPQPASEAGAAETPASSETQPRDPVSMVNGSDHSFASTTRRSSALRPLDMLNPKIDLVEGVSSVMDTASKLVTIMIGASVLGYPAMFSKTGLILGSALLIFCCVVSIYMCLLIADAIGTIQERTGTHIKKLDDIAFQCYGSIGQRGTRYLLNSFFVAKTCLYLVLIGQNMNYLVPSLPYRAWVLIITVFNIPVALLRDTSLLDRLSFIGVIASCLYGVCIVWGSIPASDLDRRSFEPNPGFQSFGKMIGVVFSSLTMMIFGFGPTDVMATVRSDMREPDSVKTAVIYSHVATFSVYWLAGMVGSWGFGKYVTGNVGLSMCDNPGCVGQGRCTADGCDAIHTIKKDEAGAKWVPGIILAVAVISNLAVTIPLVLKCLYNSVEACYPIDQPMGRNVNVAMRIGTVLFASVIGLCLPFFLHVMGIISSAMSVPVVFFLPLFLSYKADKLEQMPRSIRRWIIDGFMFVLAVMALCVGLYESLSDLVQAIKERPQAMDIFGHFWD